MNKEEFVSRLKEEGVIDEAKVLVDDLASALTRVSINALTLLDKVLVKLNSL